MAVSKRTRFEVLRRDDYMLAERIEAARALAGDE